LLKIMFNFLFFRVLEAKGLSLATSLSYVAGCFVLFLTLKFKARIIEGNYFIRNYFTIFVISIPGCIMALLGEKISPMFYFDFQALIWESLAFWLPFLVIAIKSRRPEVALVLNLLKKNSWFQQVAMMLK